LTIDPATLTVVVPTLADGRVGVAYQAVMTATGAVGEVSWRIASGTLPPGLWLDNASGAIGGVPTAWGTSTFTVQAHDSWGTNRVAEAPATITIAPAPLAVAGGALGTVAYGVAYSSVLVASGGTGVASWALTAGSLPAGLALDAAGMISGTPSQSGAFAFSATATDLNWLSLSATGTFSLTVGQPPVSHAEIVLYAADASSISGAWSRVPDVTAAAGVRMWNADLGARRVNAALATPASFFELTFQAAAGVPYHLWLRGKADGNSDANDSVYVQFSGSVDGSAAPIYRIGTKSGAAVSIQDGGNGVLSGWGWQDQSFGTLAAPIMFAASGTQTIRVQVREDGLSIDQIVLSHALYATSPPGASHDDMTILAR
jgi:hypothetical protein